MPFEGAPNNQIIGLGEDLNPASGAQGVIYTEDLGDGRFVIEYHAVEHWPGGDPETFEIILDRNDGSIVVQYQTVNKPGFAGAGIENADGSRGILYSYANVPPLAAGLAVKYTPFSGTPPVCLGPVAPAITIRRDGTTAVLSWPDRPPDTSYQVWRDTSPYFMPVGEGMLAGTLSAAGDMTYPAASGIGDPEQNMFYVVLGGLAGGISGPSNRTGEFDFSLTPGELRPRPVTATKRQRLRVSPPGALCCRAPAAAAHGGAYGGAYGTMLTESVSSPEKPWTEPSQTIANVQVVVLPSEPGVQVKISEPSPLTPVTLKLPSVVRWILPAASTQTPLMSSFDVLDSPTSEPSKYIAHEPPVVEPRAVAVKASRSSSAPDAPVTETLPVVLMSSRPSVRSSNASTSSSVVDRPTSEPSKYHDQVPAVVPPVEVGTNFRMSESSTAPKPVSVKSVSKLISRPPSGCRSKASTSVLARPMSEPSMTSVHAPVAMFLISTSSSAKATPPAVPELLEPR